MYTYKYDDICKLVCDINFDSIFVAAWNTKRRNTSEEI